jgi:hypothetical protein
MGEQVHRRKAALRGRRDPANSELVKLSWRRWCDVPGVGARPSLSGNVTPPLPGIQRQLQQTRKRLDRWNPSPCRNADI